MPTLSLEAAAPAATDLAPSQRGLFQRRRGAIAAALAAGSAALAAWAFHSALPSIGFLFLYLPLTSIVAYFGGRRPGLLTALAGLGAGWYVISPPGYGLSRSDILPFMVLFGAAGVLVAECVVRLREAEIVARGLALIVESSDDAILSKSLDGTILTWNAGAERLYGYSAAEVIGRPVSMLAPPDRVNEVATILMHLRRGNRVDHYESVRMRKDGTRMDVALTISPVKDEWGKIVGAATIARDITERKRTEQALRRRQADDELINVIATKTAGETQLDRLLAVALAELKRQVTFTGGSIALLEEQDLVVRAAIGPFAGAALEQRMRPGQGRVWSIVETGAPFLCNDLVSAGLKPTTPIRSYLGVPLAWQRQVFGVLEVDSLELGTFQQADLELLQRVSAVISGSIEVARRYAAEAAAKAEADAARQETAVLYEGELRARADAERAVSRAETLKTLTAELSGALTVTDVARICAERGAAAVRARASIVSLPSDATGEWLGIVAYTGYRPEEVAPWLRYRIDARLPFAGCMRSGEPIYLETPEAIVEAYPDVTRQDLRRFGDRAWFSVPFVISGHTIGTLCLAFARERPLSDEEHRLALTIVQQCAQALDRARLYEAERNAREEAERAVDRTGRLQEMTAALAGALTPAAVAEVIVDHGVVALRAQAGSLALLTDDEQWLEIVRAIGYPQEFVERWRRTRVSARAAAWAAIRRREPIFLESREALLAGYEVPNEPVPVLPDGGARAVVPIMAGRDVIGILSFLFAAPRSFAAEDRAFVQTIARQCAQALERARLYEREHRVAATLQRALLPADLPQLPGLAIHAAYVPGASESDVGGDWYDAFILPNGGVAVCVGDVVGRGLNAAVVMGQLRQTIRAAALQGQSPSTVLMQAGKILRWASGGRELATTVFGILDPESLVFTYAAAGHPAPLVARRGRAYLVEGPGALPLGMADVPPPPEQDIALTPETLLVLYTDGLIEVTRDPVQGEKDLVAAAGAEQVEPSGDAAHGILARVLQRRQASDDVAVVTLSVSATIMTELALALPAEPHTVRVVRQAFRRLAAALPVGPDAAAAFEVALGEAVNNIVEHAYGATTGNVQVRAWREGTDLVAEIEDHGQWRQERREGRGHGLQIMRALIDSAEVTRTNSGSIVRLAMSLRDRSEDT